MPPRTDARALSFWPVLSLAAVIALAPLPVRADLRTRAPEAPKPGAHDPLAALVRRMDRYLRRQEVDGVTMDWRYQVSPSEEIRQTVVCQLLAYVELERLLNRPRLRDEVVGHADFLIGRLEDIRSHTPFDGMLAYSLLTAYETAGETRFLDVGSRVTQDLLAIPTSECLANGGLMVAMATAEFARLTGDAEAAQKTHDILAQMVAFQNADGSFPHWCYGSRDIHYTGWMSMELIHLERMVDDVHLAPLLDRATLFLAGRIGPDGKSIYEEPCPGVPGCTQYYYSRATGCGYDYDTRGWTVEPSYEVLALDHADSAQGPVVMAFLLSLERGGTFPDLYGYWPPPEDPEYPWTIADTSVVNMSIIFWALTTELTDRARRGIPIRLVLDDDDAPPPPPPVDSPPVTVEPNPARSCTVKFALAAATDVSVAIYDLEGRRIRMIESGVLPAGSHTARWDGFDDGGRAMSSGAYYICLTGGALRRVQRVVLAR